MLQVTTKISIGDDEIELHFIRSSGPGGQHVNKVETAVQLRFDVVHSPSLPEDVRRRLIELSGSKISRDGILTMKSQRHRTQHGNRKDVVRRFALLVEQAAIRPKIRLRKSIPRRAHEKRLNNKKQRSQIKRIRQKEWS